MPNPLYQQYGKQNQSNPMIRRLEEFRRTFNGNPQQMVQNLINSGRISQQQVNQYAQQANEIYRALGNRNK
jgi:hypothetical protein